MSNSEYVDVWIDSYTDTSQTVALVQDRDGNRFRVNVNVMQANNNGSWRVLRSNLQRLG